MVALSQPLLNTTINLQLLFALSGLIPAGTQTYVLDAASLDTRGTITDIDCITGGYATFETLVECFDAFTVPSEQYSTTALCNAAQPTATEASAWDTLTASVIAVNGNCGSVSIPAALVGVYRVDTYTETTGGRSFCVLSEVKAEDGRYRRGWGLMAVPATRAAVSRYIHISAPHPKFDDGTPKQAAAIFKGTGAKSLFVAGRHRDACSLVRSCVSSNYSETDPAHDPSQPFWAANLAIRTWQAANGGCPGSSCAWIQMHGKKQERCESDTTFGSAGLANSPASVVWYNTVDSPVRRIRDQLRTGFPSWTNSIPTDSNCILAATKNVWGRLLNGVTDVCGASGATGLTVTGEFVHIEQSYLSIQETNYWGWSAAINRAMSTTCATGMSMSSTTRLCVSTLTEAWIQRASGERRSSGTFGK